LASQKIAFYAALTRNFGPVTEHTDVIFDKVITNIGDAYEPETGRFTAPISAVYQFNVIVSAQQRQKVVVLSCHLIVCVYFTLLPYCSCCANRPRSLQGQKVKKE